MRSKKYLKWVRSQPCCYTGRTDDVQAHHIISCGMGGVMGSKVSDLWTIPLHAQVHSELHHNPKDFPICQKAEALKIINKAVEQGILIVKGD